MQTDELARLLKFLTDTLQETKDFTVDQAPAFVRELLLWRFWEAATWAAIWTCIGVLLLTVGARFAGRLFEDDDDHLARTIVRGIACVILVLAWSTNALTMVQVKVAPRVVLVEMARDMIAGPRR